MLLLPCTKPHSFTPLLWQLSFYYIEQTYQLWQHSSYKRKCHVAVRKCTWLKCVWKAVLFSLVCPYFFFFPFSFFLFMATTQLFPECFWPDLKAALTVPHCRCLDTQLTAKRICAAAKGGEKSSFIFVCFVAVCVRVVVVVVFYLFVFKPHER